MSVQHGRTVDDLVKLTGFSKLTVQRAITRGEMPGYKVATCYWIPNEQFDLYARGLWQPKPQPTNVQPLDLIKQRKSA